VARARAGVWQQNRLEDKVTPGDRVFEEHFVSDSQIFVEYNCIGIVLTGRFSSLPAVVHFRGRRIE